MRRILHFIFKVLPVFIFFQSHSQIKELSIGDKCPEFAINNIIHYSKTNTSFGHLKGKVIILDFWGPNCGSCIASMPKIVTLRKEFKEKVEFFMVTRESKENVSKIASTKRSINKYWQAFDSIPFITADNSLCKYFPFSGMPHVIWIDGNGIVKAITGGNVLNSTNIERLLTQGEIRLARKMVVKDQLLSVNNKISYNITKPSTDFYYSTLMEKVESLYAIPGMQIDSTSNSIRYTEINRSISELYKSTLKYTSLENLNNRFILEIKDTSRFYFFKPEYSNKKSIKPTHYCYESVSPLSTSEADILSNMRYDLNRYLNFNGRTEKRKFDCFVIIPKSNAVSKQLTDTDFDPSASVYSSIPDLVKGMNLICEKPIIDETGNEKSIVFHIKTDLLQDMGRMKIFLNEYGFDLLQAKRILDCFVLTEK